MTRRSEDYIFTQDNNGKLIFKGDFEGFYKQIDDPWEQSGSGNEMAEYYNFSRNRLSDWLKQQNNHSKILEIGCGLGHSTNHLAQHSAKTIIGLDISQSAVNKARCNYPQYSFIQADICDNKSFNESLFDLQNLDIILLNQVLWYIMHKLNNVKLSCDQLLNKNGFVVFSTAFLRNQQYGTDIIDGFDGLSVYLGRQWQTNYKIIHSQYDNSLKYPYHDGLICLQRMF